MSDRPPSSWSLSHYQSYDDDESSFCYCLKQFEYLLIVALIKNRISIFTFGFCWLLVPSFCLSHARKLKTQRKRHIELIEIHLPLEPQINYNIHNYTFYHSKYMYTYTHTHTSTHAHISTHIAYKHKTQQICF